MGKRGIIGTLLLLVYLAGVGLFTGPSLAQIFLGRLPQPRLELIPFADMISVLTDKNAVGLGAFVNIAGNIALLFPLGLFLPLFWRWFERAGRTACLLDRHYRGKYNIRSADSVVGDSGSQDRE